MKISNYLAAKEKKIQMKMYKFGKIYILKLVNSMRYIYRVPQRTEKYYYSSVKIKVIILQINTNLECDKYIIILNDY